MTTSYVLDTEGAARTWTRSAVPLLDARVYFGFPSPMPTDDVAWATVARVGGGMRPGEAPMDDARLSFSVWAAKKKTASDAAVQLANALGNLDNVEMSTDVYAYGTASVTVLWFPDNAAGLARYVVDALVTVRGTIS